MSCPTCGSDDRDLLDPPCSDIRRDWDAWHTPSTAEDFLAKLPDDWRRGPAVRAWMGLW